jgi:hypothetical protein
VRRSSNGSAGAAPREGAPAKGASWSLRPVRESRLPIERMIIRIIIAMVVIRAVVIMWAIIIMPVIRMIIMPIIRMIVMPPIIGTIIIPVVVTTIIIRFFNGLCVSGRGRQSPDAGSSLQKT